MAKSAIGKRKKRTWRKREQRSLNRSKKLKSTTWVFFILLQVTVTLTAGRAVKKGWSRARSPRFLRFLKAAHGFTRR
jgi:hypothetical protein